MSAVTPPPAPSARLLSLDALRGFDMMWIVGADTIGSAVGRLLGGTSGSFLAAQLDHVDWAGFHFYDLIFPLFVFMVGAAVPLSLDKMAATEGRSAALARVARRTLLLYVLGLFYYGGLSTPLAGIRFVGVLQRLAFCYGATSLLYLYCKPRTLWAWIVGLLVGYWALLTFVPVPGFGAGDFAEGHNLTNWIDVHYLPGRKWDGDHDPEGLLSNLPAIASCLLGVHASLWLRNTTRSAASRGWLLVGAGALLVVLGSLWGLQFPVIKKLWTSSFVLVAGGWSCLLLGASYLIIDVWQVRAWAQPFVWIGCNPLAIYLAANIIDLDKLSTRFAGGSILETLNGLHAGFGSLVLALVAASFSFLIARFLYQRKIFIRL
jgi:predicted acyltransferase